MPSRTLTPVTSICHPAQGRGTRRLDSWGSYSSPAPRELAITEEWGARNLVQRRSLGGDEVHRFDGSLRVDLIGRKNLSADAGQQAPAFQRVSGKLNYGFTPAWTGFAQFAWYPGDRLSEAAFNFGDAVGASSSDIFVSAQPEITFQVGVTRRFNTGG